MMSSRPGGGDSLRFPIEAGISDPREESRKGIG